MYCSIYGAQNNLEGGAGNRPNIMKYLVKVIKDFDFRQALIPEGTEIILTEKDYKEYKSKVKVLKKIIEFPNELSIVK